MYGQEGRGAEEGVEMYQWEGGEGEGREGEEEEGGIEEG